MIINSFISASKTTISIDGEVYAFEFSVPEQFPQDADSWSFMWAKDDDVAYLDVWGGSMQSIEIEKTEENYQKYCQPLIDLWLIERDRIQAEEEAAKQELLKFENRKERALDSIVNDYHTALEKGFVRTSLGFDADISPDSVATLSATNLSLNRNILAEEPPKTVFRDFYGLKRELDKVQVELLICQINIAQNHIRELKYEFKSKVKETFDNESLNTALDTCVYSTLDFSNLTETNKPTVIPFEQFANYVQRIDTF